MIVVVEVKMSDGTSEKIAVDYGVRMPANIEEDLVKFLKKEYPKMTSLKIIEGLESIV